MTEQTPNPTEAKKSYQCRHIFTDGHQCGSPALRTQKLCFYHHTTRQPAAHKTVHGITFLALPAPDDYLAIQRGLAEVLRLLAAETIDDRHATALIKCLAAASANLARADRKARLNPPTTEVVQDYVQDEVLGVLAPGPEPEAEAIPIPPYTHLVTPKPTLEYLRDPEADARANAQYAAYEQEVANRKANQVQTYPAKNQDFGPETKKLSPTPTPLEPAKELAVA